MCLASAGAYANLTIIIFLCSLVLSFFQSIWSISSPQGSKLPDGPKPLPFLGTLLQWFRLTRNPDAELNRLAQKYGGICMLWLGTAPTLIVNSPEIAKELFDKRGSIYSTRPPYRQFAESYRLLTLPTGEHFRRVRKLYQMILAPAHALELRAYQDFESKVTLLNLLNRPGDFLLDQNRYALSVVFSACYGIRLDSMNHPTAKKFLDIWRIFSKYTLPGTLPIDYFPFLLRLPRWAQPWKALADDLMKRENMLHSAFLRTSRERMTKDASGPACFAASVMAVQEKEGITDLQVSDIMSMLVGAGSDTTATYLQVFFMLMALYPSVAQKAQQELDRVVGPSRLPDFADREKLPYLQAVIKEIHRFSPANGLGVPHATTQEDVYNGMRIPKGTMVLPALVPLSRSAEKYDNADVFEPDRFLEHQLTPLAAATHQDFMMRDHYHYGFGRRLCPGISVAEASIFIVLSRVLWAFDIKPLKGVKPLDMNDRVNGLVRKLRPFKLDIRPRGGAYADVVRREAEGLSSELLDFDDVMLDGA